MPTQPTTRVDFNWNKQLTMLNRIKYIDDNTYTWNLAKTTDPKTLAIIHRLEFSVRKEEDGIVKTQRYGVVRPTREEAIHDASRLVLEISS